MRLYRYLLVMLFIISAGCIVSSVADDQITITSPAGIQNTSTIKLPNLVTYVNKAGDFARSVGKEAALVTFNDKNGQYTKNDLYIFAYDYNGTTLALPYEPSLVGVNRVTDTDIYNNQIIAEIVETATKGGGIVTYYYPDPADGMTIRQKNTYCTPVDETWCIGAGIYSPRTLPVPPAELTGSNPNAEELKAFVESAAVFAHEHGKEAAISAFADKNGSFMQGGMYIIAYDMNTTNLAHPYQPWIQGLNMNYYRDIDNVRTVKAGQLIAELGGGFSHDIYRIFAGNQSLYIPKLDYFIPIDETWFIGAGTINPDYLQYRDGYLTDLMIREGSVQDLVDLVNRAVIYAEENGKDVALTAINDPNGIFTTDNIWLWAGTMDGTLIADPFMKDAIGTNILDFQDSYETATTKEAIELVKSGGGFVHGMFSNTRYGGDAEIPKLMYLKPVDETWWIAGGIYGVLVE